jgi:hypothetical protein
LPPVEADVLTPLAEDMAEWPGLLGQQITPVMEDADAAAVTRGGSVEGRGRLDIRP